MVKLTNTQIEKASVEAVNSYFNFSETLDPNIPTSDKEPVWDGSLFLYRRGDKERKKNLIGRIPTQVKGRNFKDLSNKSITFLVNVNDIKIYQHNGGIAFFVVYINPDTKETKIYYRLLAPIELRKIANNAGNKKTISVKFYALSELCNTVELEFLDFYNDCLKQHSFSNSNPIHITDIEKGSASFNVQFSTPTDNSFEALKYLTSTPQFCYVTFNDDSTNTPHPLGDGRFSFIAQNKADIPVTIEDQKYYDESSIEFKEGKTYYVIGDFIRIPISDNKDEIGKRVTSKVAMTFQTLSQRIKGYEFILALKEKKECKIGERIISFEEVNFDKNIERVLKADKYLQTILFKLNVNEELNIQRISKEDVINMNSLIEHFIFGKDIALEDDVDHEFVRIDISNISLLFFAEKKNEPNLYKLHSVHDLSGWGFITENELGNSICMPRFFAFDTETYKNVSNISYESFVIDCESMKCNDNRFYQGINWSILRMLNAYDQLEEKKQILINTAKALNQWLIENDPDKNTTFVHSLNRLQIMRRDRKLSNDDKEHLYKYIDSEWANDEVKFVCYTLLDDKHSATRYFNKLPDQTKLFYKTMPIYHFNKLS